MGVAAGSDSLAPNRARTGPDMTAPLTTPQSERPSREERAARGRAARAAVPRSPRHVGPARRSPRSGRPARGAGRRRGCPSSCRSATAGCWSRRSPSSAAPRCRWPPTWPRTPRSGLYVQLVRRRAPVELRRLRLARAPPGVRRQRLRRDAAGPVGVGRQAAGRQPRGGRPRERLPPTRAARGSCSARGARIPRRRCASSPPMRDLDVWYAHLDIGRAARRSFEVG